MPISSSLSKDQFRAELIKRFFHPDSYFSHCFASYLQAILDDGGNSNNEYLLVGNLMDRLLASERVLEDVKALTALNGFEGFGKRLNDGIQYLFDSDLEPEKMKIEIESLAKSLFHDSLNAIQSDDGNNGLKKFIGVHGDGSDLEIMLDKDDAIAELKELPSKRTDLSELEFSLAETENRANSSESLAEKESFQLAEHKDGFDINEFERGLLGEGNFSEPNKEGDERTPPVGDLPIVGVHEALEITINHLHEDVEKLHSLIESNFQIREKIAELDALLEGLVSPAMIYGLDAVEEVASKARRFLAFINNHPEFEDFLAREVLKEAAQVLKAALGESPGNPESSTIKNLCAKLGDPDKIKGDMPGLVDKKELSGPALEPMSEETVLQKEEIDLSQFKLPGEEEIVDLIGEITSHKNVGEEKKLTPEPAESLQRPEIVLTEVSEPAQTGELASYMSQAGLYFSVIDQAMETLANQPGHKTALEDVALACNSLSTLSLKMNLDGLAKLPGLVADLVKTIGSNRYSLSKEDHGVLHRAFTGFRRLSSAADIEKTEFKETLASIQKLNSKVMASVQLRREFRNIDKFKDRRQRY